MLYLWAKLCATGFVLMMMAAFVASLGGLDEEKNRKLHMLFLALFVGGAVVSFAGFLWGVWVGS